MKKFLILATLISSSAFAQMATPVSTTGGGKVDSLTNGVRVIHVTPGSGVSPTVNSRVQVTYEGTFINGRTFDKSVQPIEFSLKGVILCWTTGLQKMKVGETAKLECPAETAYGSQGSPGVIPPNTPLLFTVKLLSVK